MSKPESSEKFFIKEPGDQILLISFFFLVFIGLFILGSASYFMACERFNDCFYFLKRQILLGVLPGIFIFYFFSFYNYKRLKKWSFALFLLSLVLLTLVFIPGIGEEIEGARRWIDIGFSFQPSEVVKLFFIIYLSAWLAKNKERIKQASTFFLFLSFLIIISFLIILQPDLGTLIVFSLTATVVYFLAGARWKHLFYLGVIAIGSIAAFIKFTPYRWNRFKVFLDPSIDPTGIGFHINQALTAIRSGGIWGQGLGFSSQKISSLPQVLSDSIFAIMAEEFGFIIITIIVFLYFFIFYRIFILASKSKSTFAKLLACGIGFLFIFQSIVNMSAMLRLMPLTGIPLPLIGQGATNFVVFCFAFGILINISRQTDLDKKP